MAELLDVNWRLFAIVTLNGLTLASLYFIVASGFSLIFGLMRVVNMAHGSLYLLGAYTGFEVSETTGNWLLGIIAAGVVVAAAGAVLQVSILSWMQGQDLRQALATIGVSIVAADLMLAQWGGSAYQITLPDAVSTFVPVPMAGRYAMARLMLIGFALLIGIGLWLMLNRTKLGMVIRAGVDDRRMLEALGVNVPLVFVGVFAIGAGLAGAAGVIGGSVLSVSPGEDTRYLLSSLIVVIVGGMGSIPGAAIGALLVAMAETYGLAYTPTYAVVYTFAIMVAVLAVRPQGILEGGLMHARRLLTAAVVLLVLAYPFFVNSFWLVQIGGRTLGFGTIVLSLVFLTAYTGMLSLAQMSVAGVAGYAVAYFTAPTSGVGLLLPWPLALLLAMGLATLAGLLIGLVAVRTRGIYTLMITLAIGMGFYNLTLQNYAVFNGFTGFNNVEPPVVLGIDLGANLPFYYLSAALAAACYFGVRHLVRTPFGLALQGVRDEPQRLRSLGYDVSLLRILAFGIAGFIAGIGGILNLWLNASISPGSVALNPIIDVLMAGVLGGIGHPIGAYVGAFVFTVVDNFAIDFIARERFNTLIGLIFLAIVLFSPDGLVGLARRLGRRSAGRATRGRVSPRPTADGTEDMREDPR